MATYAQLQTEAVWQAQYVPPALDQHLIKPLRTHYGLGPTLIGAPGDNNHLKGRHRSRNWCLTSIYSTSRTYGTTDARDKGGDGDWYRAIDNGITGQTLYDSCRRLDAAVRAGRLPGVAEWFGTFDGVTVVGWFQGRPGTSDKSHLTHQHVGIWNESANNPLLMQRLFRVITGTEEDDDMGRQMLVRFPNHPDPNQVWLCDGMLRRKVKPEWVDDASIPGPGNGPITNAQVHQETLLGNLGNNGAVFASTGDADVWGLEYPPPVVQVDVELSDEDLAAVAAAAEQGAAEGAPTAAEIAEAVVDEEHDRLGE